MRKGTADWVRRAWHEMRVERGRARSHRARRVLKRSLEFFSKCKRRLLTAFKLGSEFINSYV